MLHHSPLHGGCGVRVSASGCSVASAAVRGRERRREEESRGRSPGPTGDRSLSRCPTPFQPHFAAPSRDWPCTTLTLFQPWEGTGFPFHR